MYEEALAELLIAKELHKGWQPTIESSIGSTYARMGRREDAQQVLDNLLERSKQEYVPPLAVVGLYLDLEENDKGFDWLERAYKVRDPGLAWLGVHPLLDSVRSDQRLPDMLKKIGLDK